MAVFREDNEVRPKPLVCCDRKASMQFWSHVLRKNVMELHRVQRRGGKSCLNKEEQGGWDTQLREKAAEKDVYKVMKVVEQVNADLILVGFC